MYRAAVDVHVVAGDIVRQVAGIEQHGVRDILGGAVAAGGDIGLGVLLRPGEGLAHRGQDVAGADGVGRDVERRARQSEALAQVQDAGLGAGIGRVGASAAAQRRQRGHVHHLAVALLLHDLKHGLRHEEQALEVDVHHAIPALVGDVGDGVEPVMPATFTSTSIRP